MPLPTAETRLLEEYDSDLDVLFAQMTGDAKKDSKVEKQIDQKLKVYLQQITTAKSLDSSDSDVLFHESNYHVFRALRVFGSSVLMRKMAQGSESLVGGLAAAGIARAQEKNNANKALKILDEALSISDNAYARLTKADILQAIGRKPEAITELRYITANFQHLEETYIAARKFLAELENPPKKGPCFIATACYGSYDHPDVLVLRNWRDRCLLRHAMGKLFVKWYYATGPGAAEVVVRHPRLGKLVKYSVLIPLTKALKIAGFHNIEEQKQTHG
ncbi:tetratricopeptide repeat protein [Fimbriimonas ginsengisoli]|uniref:Ig family protein n=1 Tax=Fimbriimonas ginsengisoli Gsoil 348 TaxID=661478 RepID=A0A068NLI3_FIMGI|nr:CFI-box-CTERM domain-containing protein [Fimbriimonas ginsengisoli]AIE84428.1 Ig family protein [Fimbriimonas ginsengisoli Gsoil 348]